MRSPGFRLAASAVALCAPLLVALPALAEASLEVKSGQTVVLDGTVHYKTITVDGGGKLVVRPLTEGESGTGELTIKAETVTVEKGGVIDATGAGYGGKPGAAVAPACCAGAAGGAGPQSMTSTPGGGGASVGDGAAGCATTAGSGGAHYDNPMSGMPGASGGASFLLGGMSGDPSRGGRGGGKIEIYATKVTVSGMILADGEPGITYGGVGSGGGGGGFILIDALHVLGEGLISAKGGSGGEGISGDGGSGGGGYVKIATSEPLMNDLPSREVVGGGVTGKCGVGMKGAEDVAVDSMKACVDVDGDGEGATDCGGADCDDSDPKVHGGAKPALEVCDGLDNDCNGEVDDNLVMDACEKDEVCESGACVAGSSSGSSGGDAPEPDYVSYRGACGVSRSTHANGAAFFAAAIVGLLAGLRLYRKRR